MKMATERIRGTTTKQKQMQKKNGRKEERKRVLYTYQRTSAQEKLGRGT
jgi:hypothetical protein